MSKLPEFMGNRRLETEISTIKTLEATQGMRRDRYVYFEDDLVGSGTLVASGGAGSTTPTLTALGLGAYRTTAGGTGGNIIQYITAGPGILSLLLGSTAEAQQCTLFNGDATPINLSNGPVIEMRVAVHAAVTTLNANSKAIWGLSSAITPSATAVTDLTAPLIGLDFRADGAGTAGLIYTDNDDNITDQDLVTTGLSYVSDTFRVYKIDATTLSAVKFYIDNVIVRTLNFSTVAANTLVQPIALVQRASGVAADGLRVDYVKFSLAR